MEDYGTSVVCPQTRKPDANRHGYKVLLCLVTSILGCIKLPKDRGWPSPSGVFTNRVFKTRNSFGLACFQVLTADSF